MSGPAFDLEALTASVRDGFPVAGMSDDELRDVIESVVAERLGTLPMSERISAARGVFSSMRGYGILDGILADDSVTEIMINGPDCIFVEKGGRLFRTPLRFESAEMLENIIQRIVGTAGREVNRANPIVDTRLPDGSRVNVVLPPVSLCGPVMTVRRFSRDPMTMERLVSLGSLTDKAAEALRSLVVAKYNIFISGGTGSGKTTFLNALSDFIPPTERVITIEDSAELQIRNIENLVSLETRNANTSGAGTVTVRDLIRASLRMRPERIIVGEVRGAEALDMLQAMNTGHDGSVSTGHANSCRDLLSRLETMVLTGASGLPLPAVRSQIASAIDVIIHLARFRDCSRRTAEICEVAGTENGTIVLNPLFVFRETGTAPDGRIEGRLERTPNSMKNVRKLRSAGIAGEI